jgi:hypothetical protein
MLTIRLLLRQMGAVPSTKAVGGRISVVCLTRTSRYQGHKAELVVNKAELVGTSSSNS